MITASSVIITDNNPHHSQNITSVSVPSLGQMLRVAPFIDWSLHVLTSFLSFRCMRGGKKQIKRNIIYILRATSNLELDIPFSVDSPDGNSVYIFMFRFKYLKLQ